MEQTLFKVGSVYRNQYGAIMRIIGPHPENGSAVEVGFANYLHDKPLNSAFRLSDGRCIECGADADPEEGLHLVPGSLHQVGNEWVPVEEEKAIAESVIAAVEEFGPERFARSLCEERRHPRLTWADPQPTDRWEGFTVKSNSGPMVEADNSPLTRLGDSSNPLHGSAFLAVKG